MKRNTRDDQQIMNIIRTEQKIAKIDLKTGNVKQNFIASSLT
jgi:hypothetical protein